MKPSPRNLGCRRALEHRLGLIGFASFERTRTHTHTDRQTDRQTDRHTHTHARTHAQSHTRTRTRFKDLGFLPDVSSLTPHWLASGLLRLGAFDLLCVGVCLFSSCRRSSARGPPRGFRSGRRLAAPQPNDAEAKDGSRRQAAHRS